jgi:hypothetical protein
MLHTSRVIAYCAGAVLLCAGVLASPVDTPGNSCSAQALNLEKPAYMVVDAVVRGDRLLLPDFTSGLREVDLLTGKDVRSILPMGTQRGEVTGPQHLSCGSGRCVVFGDRYFWVYYDSKWKFLHETPGMRSTASGQPLVFADRMVVYGIASQDTALGGGTPYLFIQYDDGEIVPLQEYPASMPLAETVKRIHFQGIITGGLAALSDGGWVFVDPRSYSVYVFDNRDRLTKAWRGTNPRFRAPNWAASPPVHDPSGREAYSRWQLSQPLVKRPVVLGDDLLAFVIGLPDGTLSQRHELDIYRLSGEPVAIGLPITGVTAGRLVIADADNHRIVLVSQETWEPSASTTVWQVDVPMVAGLK